MKSNVRLPSKNELKFQLESIRVQSDAVHPSFYQPQQGFMSILWSLNRLLEVTVSFYTLNTTVPVVSLVQSTTAPTVPPKKNSTPILKSEKSSIILGQDLIFELNLPRIEINISASPIRVDEITQNGFRLVFTFETVF